MFLPSPAWTLGGYRRRKVAENENTRIKKMQSEAINNTTSLLSICIKESSNYIFVLFLFFIMMTSLYFI